MRVQMNMAMTIVKFSRQIFGVRLSSKQLTDHLNSLESNLLIFAYPYKFNDQVVDTEVDTQHPQ